MPKPAPHRVAVLLCPQHSLASIGLVLDVLRMANHLPGAPYFELLRISETGQPVAHEDGLISVDGGPECLAQMDLVVIPSLWMGSLLTESFFGIPGLGSYTIDAIQAQDFAVVRAMVFVGSVLYILGLILTDISYTLVDPRIRFA